jgi:hypothetical protein
MKSDITCKVIGTGMDRVLVVNGDEKVECFLCNTELRKYEVVFWCRGRVLFCEECKFGTKTLGKCYFHHQEIEHEHIRGALKYEE